PGVSGIPGTGTGNQAPERIGLPRTAPVGSARIGKGPAPAHLDAAHLWRRRIDPVWFFCDRPGDAGQPRNARLAPGRVERMLPSLVGIPSVALQRRRAGTIADVAAGTTGGTGGPSTEPFDFP